MAGIAKKKAIELILIEVGNGKTYNDTLALFSTKWQLPTRTFATYWNEANSIYDKKQEAFQKKKDDALLKHELERQEHDLETKDGQVKELIKHALAINEEIETGKAKCFNWFRGQFNEHEITLSHSELAEKRKVLAGLLSDIRDIRGLNAPKEQKTAISIEQELRDWMDKGLVKVPKDLTNIPTFQEAT